MTKLEETLTYLDLLSNVISSADVLESAKPSEKENSRVYAEVNKVLSSHVERQELLCTHITGEMRALADPNHRQVCRINWRRHRQKANMVCYIPLQRRGDAQSIWEWNEKNWHDSDWANHLDVFDLIGDEEVHVYATPRRERIHYSVFSDEYVLLQSEHRPPSHNKHVWFIRSAELNEILKQKAQAIVKQSQRIPPRIFRDFSDSVSGTLALHLLFTLQEHRVYPKELLRSHLWPRIEIEKCLSNLTLIGFIEPFENALQITKTGLQYLGLFQQREA